MIWHFMGREPVKYKAKQPALVVEEGWGEERGVACTRLKHRTDSVQHCRFLSFGLTY